MASKTRLTELVKAFDVAGVAADLDARPELLGVRDDRGRTWLHLIAAQPARGDIPGPDGPTATQILNRKKDPAYRALAGLF